MSIFLPALLYFLFALQLYLGKPLPLYGKPGFSKAMGLRFLQDTPVLRRIGLCTLGIAGALALFVLLGSPYPLWIGSLIAGLGGLIARSGIKREGRLHGLSLSTGLGRAYPYWLFDLWTIGLTLLLTVSFLS